MARTKPSSPTTTSAITDSLLPSAEPAAFPGSSMRITCSSPEQIRGSHNIIATNPCRSMVVALELAAAVCDRFVPATVPAVAAELADLLATYGIPGWCPRFLPGPLRRRSLSAPPHPPSQKYSDNECGGYCDIRAHFKHAAELPCRGRRAIRLDIPHGFEALRPEGLQHRRL